MRSAVVPVTLFHLLSSSLLVVGITTFTVPATPTPTVGSSAALSGTPSASFAPFPLPSTVPASSGVNPASGPSSPPPVESPGVVPDFSAAWATAYTKAKAKVASMSLGDKVKVTSGSHTLLGGSLTGRCTGVTAPVNAIGFPGLCLQDSALGVRDTDFATVFPAGVNVAATFKRSLIRARGTAMGQEHVGKGVNVALGPMMNLLRVPQAGRNWEGFGADPYLTGEAAYETILGMQSAGVQACAKHFINNEQETLRMFSTSDVDDRTEHELYGLPFIRSIMAGVASVMCSYNAVNGTYACENDRMLNQMLKSEFGFQGFVMSDWLATHSTVQAANNGLDLQMPDNFFFGGLLEAAVTLTLVPQSRIDDMVTRILASWYFLGQDSTSYPAVNFNAGDPWDPATNQHVRVDGDHDVLVREIGSSSIVLLKNINGALPLQAPISMAVIGSDAGPAKNMGPNEFKDGQGEDGILAMGYGSGTANFTYLISPYEALQARARKNRTTFAWMFDDSDTKSAAVYATLKDVALVFLQSDSGEGSDRSGLDADNNGNALVQAVAAVNKNTIVVVHSVGPLVIDSWATHPNVSAILWAGLAGPEAGNAITDVLYGDYNPSGRLPYTIAKQSSDYPAGVGVAIIPYSENLNIDYRHFDSAGITPRYEFGFGLSYTTFGYSGLSISLITDSSDPDVAIEANWARGLPGPTGSGSSTALWLHRPAYDVTFTVTNTGSVAGTEIPQLYLHHPPSAGEPPSILKGFSDVFLDPGQSKTVSLLLSRFDLSIWDVVSQTWVKPNGTFGITIGASSRDGRLNGTLTI
ncbi:glycoside hydrolase superfamily [Vararia minispora EC-137]|uniref:Glycoside hydrolase superfamily n=1 Tax=Vararia minispora EC-137 TaxID=1314806 RepID=A0ACB8QSS8_9AGAM|nr:glycoside hydrolase superfamily [Vararia minispora EC-137]